MTANQKKILKILGWFLALLILLAGAAYLFRDELRQAAFQPTKSDLPTGLSYSDVAPAVELVAENLEIPWEIAFLPDSDLLVTERPGRLLRIGQNEAVYEIEGVKHVGEGGLQGLALHPNYGSNGWVYLYMTTEQGGVLTNRIERYRLDGDSLTDRTAIIEGLPGASYHDGGRIAFGPDGKLYVTVGDAGNPSASQDRTSLAGVILRLNDDGSVPDDNPFGTEVWSYGHRNPQGLAWDDEGRLWSTEHGRSGALSGYDELNLIEPGKNYGWPEIQGDEQRPGMVAPVAHSGPDETWAPAGMAYLDGRLLFAGLRGSSLYEAKLDGAKISDLVAHFRNDYGRLRAVRLGPDGFIYLSTSNRDGRGSIKANDDRIIRINPKRFE